MKAILVIDKMPNSCGECPLKHLEERWMCNLTDKIVSIDCEKPKPKLCPLKPMPEKKDIDDPSLTYDTVDKYIGYNECIEEIEDESRSCD